MNFRCTVQVCKDFNYHADSSFFLKLEFEFQASVAEFAYCQSKLIRNFSVQKFVNDPS